VVLLLPALWRRHRITVGIARLVCWAAARLRKAVVLRRPVPLLKTLPPAEAVALLAMAIAGALRSPRQLGMVLLLLAEAASVIAGRAAGSIRLVRRGAAAAAATVGAAAAAAVVAVVRRAWAPAHVVQHDGAGAVAEAGAHVARHKRPVIGRSTIGGPLLRLSAAVPLRLLAAGTAAAVPPLRRTLCTGAAAVDVLPRGQRQLRAADAAEPVL